MFCKCFLIALFLSAASCGDSEDKIERAQDKLREAGELATAAMQERIATWRDDLAELDAELADWKEKANAQAATASVEAKLKLQESIDELEAKRQELSAKLLAAGKASGAAWEEIAAGFESGWAELKAGLEDAKEAIK